MFSTHFHKRIPSINFHGHPFSRNRADTCWRTGRRNLLGTFTGMRKRLNSGRGMVSRWRFTVECRVQSQTSLCWTFGGISDTRYPRGSVFPCQYHSRNAPHAYFRHLQITLNSSSDWHSFWLKYSFLSLSLSVQEVKQNYLNLLIKTGLLSGGIKESGLCFYYTYCQSVI